MLFSLYNYEFNIISSKFFVIFQYFRLYYQKIKWYLVLILMFYIIKTINVEER